MRVVTQFLAGIRLYWRGFRTWSKDPKLMALGLVPGVITFGLFLWLFVMLVMWIDDLARWLAGLIAADGALHDVLTFAFVVALTAGALLLAVYSFVSVTSVVGQWFFEKISHSVDDRIGAVPQGLARPWWQNARRGVGEGLLLFGQQLPVSIGVFFIGLIPALGTVTAWTIGALFGGWFVALEFTSVPFERRGLTLRDRRRVLSSQRPLTLGFGTMAFIMSIFPPLAVAAMPGHVAGGTLLARHLLEHGHQREASLG